MEAVLQVAFVCAIALVAISIRPTPRPAPQPTSPAPSEPPTGPLATTSAIASAAEPPWWPTPPAGPSASPYVTGETAPAPSSATRSGLGKPALFFRGQATWWDSLGSGFYVAVRPDLGIPVGSVIQVCDAHAQHCRAVPVVTTCACLGPQSGRIVDLSLDLFRLYRDPVYGVTQVVLEAVP